MFVSDSARTGSVGEWANGNQEGFGSITYVDGSQFMGQFLNNRKDGPGRYTSADGTVFEGSWRANKQAGPGKLTFLNGDVIEGDFVNGRAVETGDAQLQDYVHYE